MIFDSETLYMSAFGTLVNLANNTMLDIVFVVNLLARYSFYTNVKRELKTCYIIYAELQT